MASILKVNTLTGVTAAGTIAVTAEGGTNTTNLQQGLAKAWGHMNGANTPAYGDSFNMGSITDNATGNYTQAFTSSMASVSYASYGTNGDGSAQLGGVICNRSAVYATGSYGFTTTFSTGSTPQGYDPADTSTSISGDLA